MKRAVTEAGVQERVNCHTFRYSFALHALGACYDIQTVKELFGYTSVETTQIYTNVLIKGAAP